MTDFLTRIEQMAGADVAQAIQAEFGGSLQYVPGSANPAASSCHSLMPAAIRAQLVDGIATQILEFIEATVPTASPETDLGAEALLAALIRRLGPIDYASFAACMPASRSR